MDKSEIQSHGTASAVGRGMVLRGNASGKVSRDKDIPDSSSGVGKSVLIHDRALEAYGFGGDHPFNPLRIRLTLELCDAFDLLQGFEMIGADPATDEDLATVHSLTYIRMVQRANSLEIDSNDLGAYGIGTSDNPVFPGIHDACAHVVGAVLKASRMVMSGEAEHAVCISGGLHHAMRSRASGFCIYNDAGVAIARLKEEYPGIRIAYVDTDAHHGDGVQWMFYDDPEVLTISMHESGRYLFPGTGEVEEMGRGDGRGYAINVPLQPFTQDGSWISCFEAIGPDALRAFRPDIIISQNGCDGHVLDPLTHLCASMKVYEHFPRRIHDLAHELCGGRWVATGGGGYDIWRVVPRAWTLLWAMVSHQEVAGDLPGGWLLERGMQSPVKVVETILDDPAGFRDIARLQEITSANLRTCEKVHDKVISGISAPNTSG